MAGLTGSLIIDCRMALRLTQQQFGDLFGRTKRTVQRWEQAGVSLLPSETETLARALYPAERDLAEQVAAAGDSSVERLGLVPSTDPVRDDVDSVVRAAAVVMGVHPDAIRAATAAAFERARDVGLDVQTVVELLTRPRSE
ncbi:MAG: hypothetical protein M3O46_21445 [Myxococcota bacterium]|nr:hypothetical protein [Myxococcota bacterium]